MLYIPAMFHILLYHFSRSFISLSLSMSCKFDSMFTDIFLPLTKLSKACVMIVSFPCPLRIRMCNVKCSKMHLYGMPTQHILHSSLVSLRKTCPHLPDWLLLTATNKIRQKSINPTCKSISDHAELQKYLRGKRKKRENGKVFLKAPKCSEK